MISYLFIGLGGAIGAITRVALSALFPSKIGSIPIKILLINMIGCFLIGLLSEIFAHYWVASINTRHFLIQGFLGGFTTFSAFALEFGLLSEKGAYLSAITYILLSVLLSLLFFFFGMKLIRFD